LHAKRQIFFLRGINSMIIDRLEDADSIPPDHRQTWRYWLHSSWL